MPNSLRALALALALALAPRAARTQQFTFPNLDWRTVETKYFVIHYPRTASAWTLDMARRIDAVHDAVSLLVGNAPSAKVTVIVVDPSNRSNGSAIPFLDTPIVFFWPTPPDPAMGLAENRSWAEDLSTHELTHIAHLTWPSRNPTQRLLTRLSPVRFGPLVVKAPQWVIEGYATYVEGKLTGSGRPHSAWRAAVLREWALHGQLPTYGQLDAGGRFLGGSMRYLVGSAFLEWLVERSGDSSLVHLWRRMSARTNRTFGDAFAGVFGGLPDDLYGRFTAELTGRALAVEQSVHAALGAAPPDSGAGRAVQALHGATGRPAVSRDGTHLAIVLNPMVGPSRVVVWKTVEPSHDSALAAARARARRLDPLDVPAIAWRPPPKRAVATLFPKGGVPFDEPRFLADGRQLLLVRYTGQGDGRIRPDLYLWNFHTGALRRVTHGAGIRHADPSPDGRSAVGDRCIEGICDVVRVDLATGRVQQLAAGTPERVFDRPRYAPDGATVAVSVKERGRWRVALLDARAASGDSLRFVDPDDGVSRYDAAFLPDDRSLVLVSEAGGVQNLARLDLATHAVQPLTLVTSAALAPAPNPATGDVYFLRLHPKGLDLSVIPDSVVRAPSPALAASLAPAARIPVEPARAFAAESLPAPRSYGVGPRRYMLLPAASVGAEGKSFGVMFAGTDPVGRLTWVAQGFFGDRGTWRGGAIGATWRGTRPAIGGALFYAEDLPSQQHGGVAAPRALDAYYAAAELHVQLDEDRLTNAHVLRAGGSVGRLSGAAFGRDTRALGFVEYRGAVEQSPAEWTFVERVGVHGSAGSTAGIDWARTVANASVTVRHRGFALSGDGAYGIVSRNGSAFEQFTLGGTGAPFFDSALLAQRVVMPALPVAVAGGRQFAAYRVALPRRGLVPYFWSGSAGESLSEWQQVVGLEATFQARGLWAVRLPDVRVVGGVGYSLSRPVRHETRGYLSLTYRP